MSLKKWSPVFAGLLVTFLAPPSFGACPGGCPRGDTTSITVAAVGPVSGILFGFTDADYQSPLTATPAADEQTSCAQPGELRTRRFEFAGDPPGLGPVHLYLDPNRSSGGGVTPQAMPQSAGQVQPNGGLYPAVNDMKFYLRLDIPDLGMRLVNVGPLHVTAPVGAWPPPEGTIYDLQKAVQFAERDPQTGAPTGPVLATLNLGSHATFYGAGPLTATLSQASTSGNTVNLTAQVSSQSSSALNAVWHFYSREKIAALGQPAPAAMVASEFGPQAGRLSLPASGSQTIGVPVQMTRPGSEPVSFFVSAASNGQIFGSKQTVRAVLPNQGLQVTAVSPETASAGASVTLTLTGTGFALPLSLSTGDPNVQITGVNLLSPQTVQASLQVLGSAAPGYRDLTVTSNGRQFKVVEAFTVTWPRPAITQALPASVSGGAAFTFDVKGDFFLSPSFVGLGPNVTVQSVQRVSRDKLTVTAQAAPGFTGPVDVIVVGANGSAALAGGLTVTP
ncbi:MAG TPA: hypothetical protein VHC97_21440 [Thermoanaerobaculia bacterium]|jgi:hypothetical protein|nr:hypothetical protein [Thermoanaerobaculia bacterium]